MAKANGIEINKGDSIKVQAMGLTVTGKVAAVYHWGEDGWDIEIAEANVPGGYSRWAERHDKGRVVEVNGQAV